MTLDIVRKRFLDMLDEAPRWQVTWPQRFSGSAFRICPTLAETGSNAADHGMIRTMYSVSITRGLV